MDGQKLYNMKAVMLISITLIAYAVVVNFLFDLPIVRYGILGAGIVAAIVKRQYIINLLIKRKAE